MTTAHEFTRLAYALQGAARALQLEAPAFRTPPHSDASRTLRRHEHATVVAVRRTQDPHDVAADMIDGVIAANRLTDPTQIEVVRNALWNATARAVAA